MSEIVRHDAIEGLIFLIRNRKVMIDRDLAELYGVPTKALNQAVKRNIERFPEEFMFQLTSAEKNELVTKCDRFTSWKYSLSLPFAFTETGRFKSLSLRLKAFCSRSRRRRSPRTGITRRKGTGEWGLEKSRNEATLSWDMKVHTTLLTLKSRKEHVMTDQKQRTITVQGRSKISCKPDTIITAGPKSFSGKITPELSAAK
jgi:hypothetical protein